MDRPQATDPGNSSGLMEVWHFYTKISSEYAKCSRCPAILKTPRAGTSGLHYHASTHGVALKKTTVPNRKRKANDVVPAELLFDKRRSYDALNDDSIDAVYARLVAKDGLSFRIIKESRDIREGLEAKQRLLKRDITVPSDRTIRNHVMEYAEKIKAMVKEIIRVHVKQNEYFSIDMDEWTSIRRRRYINVTIFTPTHTFWNLGLVRMVGSATSDRIIENVKERLEEFGLNLEKHIISLATDGCNTMKCLASRTGLIRQLCLCHGIHLAITDVLYEKKNRKTSAQAEEEEQEEVNSDDDSERDEDVPEDEEDLACEIEIAHVSTQLKGPIKDTIKKVREVGKFFRRPAKAEYLQKYIREKTGAELQLELDCETRWSSLYSMVSKFDRIMDCVEKAIVDADCYISFSREDKAIIKALVQVLEPAAATVELLSARDCTLLTARKALKMMLLQMWRFNNPLSKRLALKIRQRIEERWEDSAGVLYYLENCSYIDEFPQFHFGSQRGYADYGDVLFFSNYDPVDDINMSEEKLLQIFDIPLKSRIRSFIISMLHQHCSEDITEATEPIAEHENAGTVVQPKNFRELLQQEVRKSAPVAHHKLPQDNVLGRIITAEMTNFEKNGIRGVYLGKVYSMLLSIPSSSVESERSFSSAGRICTKIRSSLRDDTLDKICFLRSFFKNPSASCVPVPFQP